MGADRGYFGESSEGTSLPTPVKRVRMLLFVTAAITAIVIVGALLVGGFSAEILNAFSLLGEGDPRGITTLILPVLTLVFVLKESSRRYFHSAREQ